MGRELSGVILAAAPSKVPFYIAGGVLVAWAVVVAAWGITHAEFPGAKGRARLVMLTTLVLVAATMTAAVLTGGEAEPKAQAASAAAPAPPGRTLALAADPSGALRFDKTKAAVLSGRVTVEFNNTSSVPHNVTIAQGSKTIGGTDTIAQSSAKLPVTLGPGEYVYFCSVPGHRQAGM